MDTGEPTFADIDSARIESLARKPGKRRFANAREIERRIAEKILAAAPHGVAPLEVARYVATLETTNRLGYRFNEEWPRRYGANPLIAHWLAAAGWPVARLKDAATSDWGAAFVHWCLVRAGSLPGHAAGTAAGLRQLVDTGARPQPGDVAVFADVDWERHLLPTGHVAFFLRDHGDTLQVLGAVERYSSQGRVAEVAMPRIRVDPAGRIDRLLLGVVPIAALQHLG